MAADWYCEISGKHFGPFSAKQLRTLVEQGKLAAGHRVRQGTDGAWVPAGRVKGLFPAEQAAPAAEPQPSQPVKAVAASGPNSKPAAKTLPRVKARPAAQPVAQAEEVPVARSAPEPPRRPPMPPPVAQQAPVVNSTPIASQPQPGAAGLNVMASPGAPTARTGAWTRGVGGPRKRRNQQAIVVVALAVLLVGLGVTAVVLWAMSDQWGGGSDDPVAAAGKGGKKEPGQDEEPLDENLEDPAASGPGGGSDSQPTASAVPTGDPPDESKYVDASKLPLTRGPVRVRIASAVQGVPTLKLRVRGAPPPPKSLMLTLRLENTDQGLKLDYTSWGVRGMVSRGLTLRDEKGNEYQLADFGRAVVDGTLAGQTPIYPDDPLEDLLVFQRPLPSIDALYLDLPARVFEPLDAMKGAEDFHFRIPASMIQTAAEPTETPGPEEPLVPPSERPTPPEEQPPEEAGPPRVTRPEDDPFGEVTEPAPDEPREGEEPRETPPAERPGGEGEGGPGEPNIFDDYPGLKGEDDGRGEDDHGFEEQLRDKFGPGGQQPPPRGRPVRPEPRREGHREGHRGEGRRGPPIPGVMGR